MSKILSNLFKNNVIFRFFPISYMTIDLVYVYKKESVH